MKEEKGWNYRNFVVPVHGLVKSVIGGSKPMINTPSSEIVMGRESPEYLTGYQNRLEIEITSLKQRVVKKIIFNGGNSPVLAEQEINAYVLKADEERQYPSFYVKRDFKEEETALWIEILGQDGKVLRRDYGNDIPKED